MQLHVSGCALAGQEGRDCDDAWATREREGVIVAALADGISGCRRGGVAAQRAVDMMVEYCLARPRAWSPRRALGEFTVQINRQLFRESTATDGAPELGCTLSAIILEGGRLYGCNVGDSPVFQWRRGRLQRLSEAHCLEAPGLHHVLTRAVGLAAEVEPHLFETDVQEDDLLLLCSDGVSNALTEPRLAELLCRQPTARTLVQAARLAVEEQPALRDDVSAIVLHLEDLADVTEAGRQRLEILASLRSGERVDGYALLKPLAPNERVWLAEAADGGQVVLKFPPRDAVETEALRTAFVREAWNASRLESPDLVRAWIPEGPTLHCYAMEYIDAPTLATVLQQGRLTVEETHELARFLVRVAEFLLSRDLAHGDIKPENIVVCRLPAGMRFRLLDLGSAVELFANVSRAGTASYLAPERFHGAPIAERSELYSIGATLYQAVTGALPYGEIERFQTPRFESQPRPPSRLNPAVPPWLESIILRAVDPDPNRRYQHFSELGYQLDHPESVPAHHRKGAPLLERNPLRFWKFVSLALTALCLFLAWRLFNR